MDPESTIIRSALTFVTGDSVNICRLCFAPTNGEEVSLSVSVNTQQPFFDEDGVTFYEMLNELGVPEEPLLPHCLCSNCATNTINSYLYKRQWQYTTAKWNKILDQLGERLTQSESLCRPNQTAYLIMNEKKNFVITSFRKNPIKNKTLAMLKLRNILSNKQKYKKKKQICHDILCIECGVLCKSKKMLLHHSLRMHKGSGQKQVFLHSCQHCTKYFTSDQLLKLHIARVHMPKTIKCSHCPQMFSTQNLRYMHFKNQHEAHKCVQCDTTLDSYTAFRRHLETHTQHKCPKCNKTLKSKNSIKAHLKICGKKRSDCVPTVFCELCNKGYSKKTSLEQHMKTQHGYGQSYSCDWCSKKFNAPSSLKNHIVKHTRERKYCCYQCGGQFVTQLALTYHIRLHTGEKPFECDMCSERFVNASRRAEHKAKSHIEPQFECSICSLKFALNRTLKKHMIRHNDPLSKMYQRTINDD